jgi:hypothetical protein
MQPNQNHHTMFTFHHSVYCFFSIVLSANPSPEVPEGTRLQKKKKKKKEKEKDML